MAPFSPRERRGVKCLPAPFPSLAVREKEEKKDPPSWAPPPPPPAIDQENQIRADSGSFPLLVRAVRKTKERKSC